MTVVTTNMDNDPSRDFVLPKMENLTFVPASQIVTTKMALIAFLEGKVKEMTENIARYERALVKFQKVGDQEQVEKYKRKIMRALSIKDACTQTIIRQKEFIKGK